MKKIEPNFTSDSDKLITLGMIITTIFFVFIPSLLVIAIPRKYTNISDSSYDIAKAFFNFELFLFLVSLLFMIPIIGWIVGVIVAPLMMILNIIIVIINLCALAKGDTIKVPVVYEFI